MNQTGCSRVAIHKANKQTKKNPKKPIFTPIRKKGLWGGPGAITSGHPASLNTPLLAVGLNGRFQRELLVSLTQSRAHLVLIVAK